MVQERLDGGARPDLYAEDSSRHFRILTLRGAACLLGVHPNTVRTHAREGRLPAAKVGRDWRFLEADLVAWLRSAYPARARVQLGADRKEAIWHSGNVQEFTMSSSQRLTERSLDALLERPTGKRPKRRTTG